MKQNEVRGYFASLEGSAFLSAGYHTRLADWLSVRQVGPALLEVAEGAREVERVVPEMDSSYFADFRRRLDEILNEPRPLWAVGFRERDDVRLLMVAAAHNLGHRPQ